MGGMEVVDSFYAAYGEIPLMYPDSVMIVGNEFLDQRYPQLDTIARTRAGGPGG